MVASAGSVSPAIIDDPAEATGHWLQRVLAANGHDTTITSISRESVGTGQMAHNERYKITYDGDAGEAKAYVDGRLEGTESSPTNDVGNNNRVIEMFGVASTTAAAGACGMAALWDRPLTHQDVAALWADPYRMWREPRRDFAQLFGNPPPDTFKDQTYFVSF